MIGRIDDTLRRMEAMGLDALVITGRINRMYFSGFTGSAGALFISKEHRILFTDFRYRIQAKEQLRDGFEYVEIVRGDAYTPVRGMVEQLKKGARVGFEDAEMSVSEFSKWQELPCEFVPFSKEILAQRSIKTEEEKQCILRAQQTSERAFDLMLKKIKPGVTELWVYNEMLYLLRDCGAEDIAFAPIIGSGPNGAMCHALPSDRQLQKGDLVVMDFGSIVDGYCSDMTRTIGIGSVSDELRRAYDIVLEAQLKALDALKPGLKGKELDGIARRHIEECGYGEDFGHGLGHGYGLLVHEAPTANPTSEDVFVPGMTITVEPGIYIEGKGGVRIEDCCMVTEDGKFNFVTTTKELIII